MKTTVLTTLAMISLFMISLSSCSADDAPVTDCFNEAYNGTYDGSGTINGAPFSGNLIFTKLECTTAKYEAGGFTENISNLTASSSGGYTGTTSSGGDISITLNGNMINITDSNGTDFTGTK